MSVDFHKMLEGDNAYGGNLGTKRLRFSQVTSLSRYST